MLKRCYTLKFSLCPSKDNNNKKNNKKKFGYLWLSAISLGGEGWRGWLASGGHLVEVLLAVDLLLGLVQKLQHLPDDGLQRTAQVFTAVRLSERRHMNKGGATVAQVQRRVVGEITEIPVRGDGTASHE